MKRTKTLHNYKPLLQCKIKLKKSLINREKNNNEALIPRNITAVQQLAETFGSLDEVLELFDDMLARMMWAYSGREQPNYFLTGDYDFINQLKRAVKTDLLGQKAQHVVYNQLPEVWAEKTTSGSQSN